MKKVLFNLLVTPLFAFSQSFVNRTYSPMFDIQARSAVQMGNGNYLVTGTQAFANGFLSVHTPQGQTFQSNYLSQSALSNFSDFNQITKINDTMAIIGGKISLFIGAAEIWQGITISVNQDGELLWSFTHSITDPGMDATVRDIERINDSTFLVLTSGISGISNTLCKMSCTGNVFWTKSYDSNMNGFQLNDLCMVDANIYVCGNVFSAGNFSGIILHLDSDGNLMEGNQYDHSVQPDFIQIVPQENGLIIANKGHALEALNLMKVELNGIISEQKTYPMNMAMPEDQALKPIEQIDSSAFWYWNGGNFGSMAYRINSSSLMPELGINHMGNIQRIIQQDTSLTILSTGPLYGIKNQIITQKHYAITSADSVDLLYNYCSYPQTEMPLNELAPIITSFTPTVNNGPSPSPLFYPLNSNEPWVNEPFCVEMLGALNEENLKFGPNPCDDEIHIDGKINQPYTVFSIDGKLIQQGKIDISGDIKTSNLPNGNYLIKVSNNTIKVAIKH